MAEKREARIVKIIQENHDTKTYRVSLDGSMISFKPGQFLNLFLFNPDGTFDVRSYSVASSPTKYWYDFTIKLIPGGRFSEKLVAVKEGTKCRLVGSFGRMFFDETKGKNIVLIAGGVGITPMASMIRWIDDKKMDVKMSLFYTVREHKDMLFQKEFEEIAARNENSRFIPTITRDAPEGWKGETVRIGEDMIKKHVKNPKDATYFLCGATEMVKGLAEALGKMGVPKEKIEFEDWVK